MSCYQLFLRCVGAVQEINAVQGMTVVNPLTVVKRIIFFSLLVVFSTGSLAAQANDRELESWISSLQWQTIDGGIAADVGVSPRNVVYVVSDKNRIYRWRIESGWQFLPGFFKRVTVDSEHKPWAIDQDGLVRRYNGLWWDTKGLLEAVDIGSGVEGTVAALSKSGVPHLWNKKSASWEQAVTSGHDWDTDPGFRITVDSQGELWVVLKSGQLLVLEGNAWRKISGKAGDIAAGHQGRVLMVSEDGKAYVSKSKGQWQLIPGVESLDTISVGEGDFPWVVNTQGMLTAATSLINATEKHVDSTSVPVVMDLEEMSSDSEEGEGREQQAGFIAIAGQVEPTATEKLVFHKISNAIANQIAIGPEGSVFILGAEGEILRWQNNRNTFLVFPGVLKRLSVDPYGLPWGINTSGDVYRHVDGNWQKIRNFKAQDIAIGAYGQVYATSSAENVFLYNVLKDSFERVSGLFAAQISVTPDGNLWTVRDDGRVFQCEGNQCEYRNRRDVSDISIGPEGSVFIVAHSGKLYRWMSEQEQWELIFNKSLTVGVGPGGYPWVTDSSQQVWRTVFFDRDESKDLELAQKTVTTTVDESAAGQSSITINKSLLLASVKNPAGSTSADGFWLTPSLESSVVHLVETGSGSNGNTTWVNSYCLLNPLDLQCVETDMWFYCQSGQVPNGSSDPGCQDCNDPANQNTSLCTAYTGNEGTSGWNNGYCLFNPNELMCQMQQGQQGCQSAACVDCNDPINQLGTVCVELNNNAVSDSESRVWASSSTSYGLKDYKKVPNDHLSWFMAGEDNRHWAIDSDNVVYRETSPNRGKFTVISGTVPQQAGANMRQVVTGGGNIYALNDAQEVYQYDSARNRFIRYAENSLYRRIAAGANGELWGIDSAGRLKRYEEGVALNVPKNSFTLADELAIGANGTVYVIGSLNNIPRLLKYSANNDRLDLIKSSANSPARITVDNSGRVWIMTTDGKIYRAR